MELSVDFSIVTFFAVHDLRSIGCVRRLYILTTFITFSFEEFSGITELHAVEMTLVGVSARYGQVMLTIEV